MRLRLLAAFTAMFVTFALATPAHAVTRHLLYFQLGTSTNFQCTTRYVTESRARFHWNLLWRPAHNGGAIGVRVLIFGTPVVFQKVITSAAWPNGQGVFDIPIIATLSSRLCWNPRGTPSQAAGHWRVEAYSWF